MKQLQKKVRLKRMTSWVWLDGSSSCSVTVGINCFLPLDVLIQAYYIEVLPGSTDQVKFISIQVPNDFRSAGYQSFVWRKKTF